MTKTTIGKGDWIVVCDGRKALIYECDEKFVNLRTKESYDHPDASTHEQGTSPPGRSFQSTGHGRSAVSQTDWHDEASVHFYIGCGAMNRSRRDPPYQSSHDGRSTACSRDDTTEGLASTPACNRAGNRQKTLLNGRLRKLSG